MKKEKLQEPEAKTWLNRLEKYMTKTDFEFKTKDLLFRCHIEQRVFNSDWEKRNCFVVEIHIQKWSLKDLLVRENEDPIFSTDEAIDQVNKFFENNFFSNKISPF